MSVLIQRSVVSVQPGDAGSFPSKDASTLSDLCTLVSSLNIHFHQSLFCLERFSMSVRISFLLSVGQLRLSSQIVESCQTAVVINTLLQICASRGIPVTSVTLSACLLLLSVLFSLQIPPTSSDLSASLYCCTSHSFQRVFLLLLSFFFSPC